MRNITWRLMIALLTFGVGVSVALWFVGRNYQQSAPDIRSESEQHEVKREDKSPHTLDVPQARWEQFYFEAIDERAKLSNLRNLRETVLPKDDLEVRIWEGFGLVNLQGYVIKRKAGQWSGVFLRGVHDDLPRREYVKKLVPKSSWDVFWKRLTDEGLLTLPDAERIGWNEIFPDATGYVIEISKDRDYRTYLYSSPELSKCKEAKQIIKIMTIVVEELSSENKR